MDISKEQVHGAQMADTSLHRDIDVCVRGNDVTDASKLDIDEPVSMFGWEFYYRIFMFFIFVCSSLPTLSHCLFYY